MTTSSRLQLNGNINGMQHNVDIENRGTSLIGTVGSPDSLDITINFTDSSTVSVTLRN